MRGTTAVAPRRAHTVLSIFGIVAGCSEARSGPPAAASSAEAAAESAPPTSAAPAPTWTAKKPTGKSDPNIHDEWNQPPPRPAGVPTRCTLKGCNEQARLQGTLAEADAAPGDHVFTIAFDGRSVECKVTVASATERSEGKCTGGEVTVALGPKMRQVETHLGGVVAMREEAIPGEHEWSVEVQGQPVKVRVIHRLGKRVVLDDTAALRYGPTWPNGPGCPPPCFQAAAELAPRPAGSASSAAKP